MSLALQRSPSIHDAPSPRIEDDGSWHAGQRVAQWHAACWLVFVVVGLGAALFALSVRLTNPALSSLAISAHGLVLTLLVLIPGLSFAIGPWIAPKACSSRELRARWMSFGLYALGGLLVTGPELLSRQPHGLSFYLRYFEAGYRLALVQAYGLALVAIALAIDGWLWLMLARSLPKATHSSALVPCLGMAGFIRIMLAPFALAMPLFMSFERFGFGVFRPELGGDPNLLSSIFWIYVQPLILITAVPALGLVDAWRVKASEDARGSHVVTVAMGVAICTLMSLSWGIRPEVDLSVPVRSFFTFIALMTLLLLGQPVVIACLTVSHWRQQTLSSALASLTVAALALGSLLLLPSVLPFASLRLAGTWWEGAQLHFLALGASLLPVALAISGQPDNSTSQNRPVTHLVLRRHHRNSRAESSSGATASPVRPY